MQDNKSGVINAKYDFSTNIYQNIIVEQDPKYFYNPIWNRIREVDLNMVWEELKNNDPRYIEFIKEVREEMKVYTKKSKPISLYDRMATLCFSSQRYQNIFNLVQAQRENLGLENNPVLRKMRDYKRKDNN